MMTNLYADKMECLGCKKLIQINRSGYCKECAYRECSDCGKRFKFIVSMTDNCGKCRRRRAQQSGDF